MRHYTGAECVGQDGFDAILLAASCFSGVIDFLNESVSMRRTMPAIAKSHPLNTAYGDLHKLFLRYAPPFKAVDGRIRGKSDLHLIVPKAVAIPGAYGGKPVDVAMASLVLQKAYVGFYFMPIYIDPKLRGKLPPRLTKLLKGKSCFHITKLDDDLLDDIEIALNAGVKCFRGRGWV